MRESIDEEKKSELPMEIEDGLTMTDMTLTNNCLTYSIKFDESLYDISMLKMNKKELKKMMKENIKDMDTSFDFTEKTFLTICKEMGINLRFHFKGNKTKKSCDIDIYHTEL